MLATAAAGAALGARPTTVRLFFGPRVVSRTVRGVRWELGLLPTGGFAQFGQEGEVLAALPAHRRLLVVLAGPLATLGVGLVLGAPLAAFVRGFGQPVAGALAPTVEGARLLHALAELLRGPYLGALALLALKFAAFNLLPGPSLAGFQALEALASLVARRPVKAPGWVTAGGVVAVVALAVGWLAALVSAR